MSTTAAKKDPIQISWCFKGNGGTWKIPCKKVVVSSSSDMSLQIHGFPSSLARHVEGSSQDHKWSATSSPHHVSEKMWFPKFGGVARNFGKFSKLQTVLEKMDIWKSMMETSSIASWRPPLFGVVVIDTLEICRVDPAVPGMCHNLGLVFRELVQRIINFLAIPKKTEK